MDAKITLSFDAEVIGLSCHCILFAEKKSGNTVARRKIALLCEHLSVSKSDQSVVQQALSNAKIRNFEDGIQYCSTLSASCNCIITENSKDFYFSEIEVLSPEQFLQRYF